VVVIPFPLAVIPIFAGRRETRRPTPVVQPLAGPAAISFIPLKTTMAFVVVSSPMMAVAIVAATNAADVPIVLRRVDNHHLRPMGPTVVIVVSPIVTAVVRSIVSDIIAVVIAAGQGCQHDSEDQPTQRGSLPMSNSIHSGLLRFVGPGLARAVRPVLC
jgi:hypothetical protein